MAQTWTHNDQNEITSVSWPAATLSYHRNGNLTKDETGKRLVYDAWNRLVAVKDSSNNVIASSQYNGLGRQVSETKSGTTRDFYYSDQWQVLEERVEAEIAVSPSGRMLLGPDVAPGANRVVLTVDGQELANSLLIEPDPTAPREALVAEDDAEQVFAVRKALKRNGSLTPAVRDSR
jgi:RHS Repeat